MLNPRVASRYAKSLMDVAVEANQMDTVQNDMKYVGEVCKSSKEFTTLLRSPIISSDRKQKIIQAVLGGKVSQLTELFINLLLTKGREASLPEIATSYGERYNLLKGINVVKLTTAVPISQELQQSMINRLKAEKKIQHVEVQTIIDPSIIGGYKMQIGDMLIDASISRDLKDVRKQFLNNDYLHSIR